MQNPLRKTRKLASPKSVKPWWLIVLRVTLKNVVNFFFLVGLVQMVRELVIRSGSCGSVNLKEFSEMEGRIADVESYLKRTTQELQDVDKQMKGEILSLRTETDNRFEKNTEEITSSLRSEMDNRFEKNSEEITSRLNMLDEKHQLLEKALGQLNSKDLLSKEDFTRLYEEFIKSKIDLSLDEIRALARQIVEQEIEKHAADGLGRVDYALGTDGAMVLDHSKSFFVGNRGTWYRKVVPREPAKMLTPSFGEPGQCYALEGSSGFAVIKLRAAIISEAVTLEHVAKSVANDRSDAPRDCRVFGWLRAKQQGAHSLFADTELSVDGEYTLLTEFTYDLDKSNAQTYNVLDSASSAIVDTIRFEFTSNHGSPSHTCIYRIRVHGHEPNLIPPVH